MNRPDVEHGADYQISGTDILSIVGGLIQLVLGLVTSSQAKDIIDQEEAKIIQRAADAAEDLKFPPGQS